MAKQNFKKEINVTTDFWPKTIFVGRKINFDRKINLFVEKLFLADKINFD